MDRASAPIHPHVQPGLTSVIVVAADSGIGLIECVARVLATNAKLELLVSDNASTDGSIERIRSLHAQDPRFSIVDNGANLGFGAGVNRAARQASGDILLVLNPDCMIEPQTIARLREMLAAAPTAGVLGARIIGTGGEVEAAARRRDPTLRRSLMSVFGLDRWQKRWPSLAGVNLPVEAEPASMSRVDAVSGAVMAIPRDVFERLAGFDEAYFLHCEDLDICRRARDQGFDVLCGNEIRVVHAKGGSSRHRPVFVSWHKHHGMWLWFRRFDPAARNPLLAGMVWTGLWMHFVLGLPGRVWTGWRARRRARNSASASD